MPATHKSRFALARVLSEGPRDGASPEPVSVAHEPASDPAQAPRRPPTVALGVKRWLDVSVGIAMGAVALPLMFVIAVAILVDSPGPVLFRPTRIGRNGKHFAMCKFRTMVNGAHERIGELAHLNVADGMVKIPNDPRVTRVGRWLRRFSLDELPQIYNILVGHMSLVGPRPHDTHELPADGLEDDPRLSVRPGLTGLWQVSARTNPSLASRVHYDLHYVNRWSLLLDAKILAKTIPAVVLGKGGSVDGDSSSNDAARGLGIQLLSSNGAPPALLSNSNGDGYVARNGAYELGVDAQLATARIDRDTDANVASGG